MTAWTELLKANGITPGKRKRNTMGQGYYTVIAFGAVHTFDDGAEGENLGNWILHASQKHKVQGRTKYEARANWFGFFVAENGSGVSNEGDGCELFSYEVFDLASIVKAVELKWPAQVERCMAAYETLRELAAKNGIALPNGHLMLVNDYD